MWSRPRKPSVIADVSDRDLVRLHWPSELRPAFDALFAIDDALADVVFKASQPALGAIKLAWWRDRLIALDDGAVPTEPRLASVAANLLPRGVAGVDLAELVTGWATLLDEQPQPDLVTERGARLFGLAARLLEASADPVAEAGRFWAPVALARATGDRHWLAEAGAVPSGRIIRALRPVTALAALAVRDSSRPALEPESTPGRAWVLLRHRWTGRFA